MQRLTDAEMKLLQIIWEHNHTHSRDLVRLCADSLSWKKSTTYTILKKLENKKMVVNENAIVSFLISREEYMNDQNVSVIEQYFTGSLPKFITAFVRQKRLSRDEIEEIEKIIAGYKEGLDE